MGDHDEHRAAWERLIRHVKVSAFLAGILFAALGYALFHFLGEALAGDRLGYLFALIAGAAMLKLWHGHLHSS